jgi:light-regulated signal transduction histidine kinase (bacteriophytochrome)
LVRELPSLRDYMTSRAAPSNNRTKGRELACGIALRMNGRISILGATPDREQIEAMSVWLAPQIRKSDGVFMTDRLGDLWAPAKAFAAVGAGLLAATVSRTSRDWVLWFSPESVENIRWGSDPGKVTNDGPSSNDAPSGVQADRVFQVWRQTVRGRSRPWLSRERDAAFDLHALLLGLAMRRMEDAARELDTAQAVERLLMANLEVRVANALSTIQALVMQSSRTASALGGLTASIDHRIHSMDRAHALLGDNRWEGASVCPLIHAELDAYIHDGYDISISGPDVVLTPQAALALALAIHELATNAAKFGSLSVPGGRVTIQWRLAALGGVILEWGEIGGPRVEPPTKRGFGSNLIERVLAMEPGGHSSHLFDCAGVTCEIGMPSSSISRLRLRSRM